MLIAMTTTHLSSHATPNQSTNTSLPSDSATTDFDGLSKTPTFDNAIELEFDPLASLSDNIMSLWQNISNTLKRGYAVATDTLGDELLVRGSEKQLNDALFEYVVQNVEMVHKLFLTLHNNHLRLYATIYTSGVFASVACNFRLVTIELNSDYQRLVFQQLSDTEILTLHSDRWYLPPLAKAGVKLYRLLLKKDPLPFALQKIKVKGASFAVHKGEYIYLDIGRYLPKNITAYFSKAQVNDAYTTEGNLLAKVQINFANLINIGTDGDDIISEKDNPSPSKKDNSTSNDHRQDSSNDSSHPN